MTNALAIAHQTRSPHQSPTAVIYCEGFLGTLDGKTANGLIQHSQAYRIVSVIDAQYAGQDSGEVVHGKANGIPVVADLAAALIAMPAVFIYGMAPITGILSPPDRAVVSQAITYGMDIVSGLHEFLADDPVFSVQAKAHQVTLRDIRKPKASQDLRTFDGSISQVQAIRIAILGTDCAIGKRTTAQVLKRALNDQGIATALVTTGQTGLMQGGRHGIAMDAIPAQFAAGELEGCILNLQAEAHPAVIIIEGQGALSHPAFCTSALILRGSQPQGVILQHAPKRQVRCDFPTMEMPSLQDEIHLIETFCRTRVIGITLNHEGMNDAELQQTLTQIRLEFGLPVCDAWVHSDADIAAIITQAFPEVMPAPAFA